MSETSTTRRVTAADIARSLGISRATVGFVLNDTPGQTISAATRRRVIDEAERLGYRPHSAARALASGRTHLILMVLPDWPLDFTLRRNIEEASLALDEAGYSLITYTPHPTSTARPLWETLQPDVVMSLTGFTADQVTSIRAAGISTIIPDPDSSPDRAYVEEGPRLQIEHLYALGHRRIAFAGSRDPRLADLVGTRRATVQRAAAALGLESVLTSDFDYSDAAVPEIIAGWRDAGVTAVAAYNDDIAATTVGAALRLGLRVPADLAVIGYDDTPLAMMMEPQLSTVRIDTAGLGRYSAALAISAATGRPAPEAGPEFSSDLIVRASTRPES